VNAVATTVTITDPRALRAFAHPARQRLIDELANSGTLTATEAAELVGLSPSATSHHLRALERYGLAERAPGSKDGRERPWQAATASINLDPGSSPSAQAATGSLIRTRLEQLAERFAAYIATSDSWQGAFRGLAWKSAWLTQEEAIELQQRLDQVWDSIPQTRTRRNRPPETRHISLALSVLPIDPYPPEHSR